MQRFVIWPPLLVVLFLLILVTSSSGQDSASIHSKNKSLTVLPIPSFDRSKGVGLGLIGMLFLKSENPLNPTSRIGGGGLVTTKGNWYVGLYEQMYFDNDNWRITSAQVIGNTNFQTYVSSPDFGETEIPFQNTIKLFYLQAKRQILKDFYTGLQVQASQSKTTFSLPETGEETTTQNDYSIGIPFSYDSRNHVYNPNKGLYVNLNLNTLPQWLGNISGYSKITANMNYYISIDTNMVLASRASLYNSFGTVPFVGQKVIGGTDIRGYTKGLYRGNQAYSLQTELRWHLKGKLGIVGFGGVAVSVDDNGNASSLLPAIGSGLRYLLVKQEGINVGIDAAIGKNDFGIYFRLSEAF